MVEPNIVFCEKNHIYDAAIHSVCPYCLKIVEEQKALSKTIFNEIGNSFDCLNDESTEMIFSNLDQADDCTELLQREDETDECTELLQQEIVDDDEECTELINYKQDINEPEQSEILDKNMPLIGWLVCVSSNNSHFCRSFEIVSGENFLREKNGVITLSNDDIGEGELIARIIYNNLDRKIELSSTGKASCLVNEVLGESHTLNNYDKIIINSLHYVFVEFMM